MHVGSTDSENVPALIKSATKPRDSAPIRPGAPTTNVEIVTLGWPVRLENPRCAQAETGRGRTVLLGRLARAD